MLIPNDAVGQCDVSCYHGTCTGRNQCTCHDGWNGTRCNRGKSHPYMEILPIANLCTVGFVAQRVIILNPLLLLSELKYHLSKFIVQLIMP